MPIPTRGVGYSLSDTYRGRWTVLYFVFWVGCVLLIPHKERDVFSSPRQELVSTYYEAHEMLEYLCEIICLARS